MVSVCLFIWRSLDLSVLWLACHIYVSSSYFQNGAVSDTLEKVDLIIVISGNCNNQLGQVIQYDQICASSMEANNACFVSVELLATTSCSVFILQS